MIKGPYLVLPSSSQDCYWDWLEITCAKDSRRCLFYLSVVTSDLWFRGLKFWLTTVCFASHRISYYWICCAWQLFHKACLHKNSNSRGSRALGLYYGHDRLNQYDRLLVLIHEIHLFWWWNLRHFGLLAREAFEVLPIIEHLWWPLCLLWSLW